VIPAERPTTSLALSNATKLLWPDAGVTKQGLLDHYAQVWERMRPYVVNRPLSLVRAPDGVAGKQRFFQKHASPGMLTAISKIADPVDGEDLLFVKDFDGVAALVQLGVVEIHVWGSAIDDVERPDQIIFDLDPDEGLGNDDVRAAAFDVKRRLEQLELPTFVKVSGGKGYHVVVPVKPKADWVRVKGFAHDFARAMAQTDPDKYTATLSKKARKGRIFVDYLRNGRGATAIAPWSSRAKPMATVAVPISWEDLENGVTPDAFRIAAPEVAEAVVATDPWADFHKARKPI
jgi:bifunctional non-homologous end joining protein LigD